MDYQELTIWMVIKRFILGWGVVIAIITAISCIKYKEYIVTAFTNNFTAWITAVVPCIIILYAIGSIIRSAFGHN